MNAELPKVCIHIVTYNHQRSIERCLEAALNQEGFVNGENLFVVVRDNASSDRSATLVEESFSDELSLHRNEQNLGFAVAHNLGLSEALNSLLVDYVLVLNPDLRLEASALQELVLALQDEPQAGLATPKLFRADDTLEPLEPRVLDACGMYFTPSFRHFDRGSGELDCGQYEQKAFVFGGTGAALLLSKRFIYDASLRRHEDGRVELFDEQFFAFREDAELAFRALRLGWRTIYVPQAIGYHTRQVLPERRAQLPAELNALGVQNRFLLQISHLSWRNTLKAFLPTMWRNLVVLGAVLSVERGSFAAAKGLWKLRQRAVQNRRIIAAKERLSGPLLARWLSFSPRTQAVPLQAMPAKGQQELLAIVVNYNADLRLYAAVEALCEAASALAPEISLSIIVVDNASSDHSAELCQERNPEREYLRYLLLQKNLGFAGAINMALEEHRLHSPPPAAVLLLNPDVLISADALYQLCQTLERYPQLGALSPLLCGIDNKVQSAFVARAFPSLGSVLAELFFLHKIWPKNPWSSSYLLADDLVFQRYLADAPIDEALPYVEASHPYTVEQPAGACLLIRGEVIARLGGFDEQFYPAWFEDVDFCKQLAEEGYFAAVLAQAKVIHEGGYSKEIISPSAYALAWYPNLYRYCHKHFLFPERVLLEIFLRFALVLRSLVAFYRGVAANKDSVSQPQAANSLAGTLFCLALSVPFGRLGRISALIQRGLSRFERACAHVALGFEALCAKKPREVDSATAQAVIKLPAEALTAEPAQFLFIDLFSKRRELFHGRGLKLCSERSSTWHEEGLNLLYLPRKRWASLSLCASGDELECLSNTSLGKIDFLIIDLVLEELRNPLGALLNCFTLLAPESYIELRLTDPASADYSRMRPATFEHLLLDAAQPDAERDFSHLLDYARFFEAKREVEALLRARQLRQSSEPLPYHLISPALLSRMLSFEALTPRSPIIRFGPLKDSSEAKKEPQSTYSVFIQLS